MSHREIRVPDVTSQFEQQSDPNNQLNIKTTVLFNVNIRGGTRTE